jgi:hypothetical protein
VSEAGSTIHACGRAARWLPRTLAGAVFAAGLLAMARPGTSGADAPPARPFRAAVVLVAGVAALWIVRRGGELRGRNVVGPDSLAFEQGPHRTELPFDEVESLRYEAPFGVSRSWLPAAVVVGRDGRAWRLPALLADGARAIETVIERSGRSDLAAWAEAQRVVERMGRATTHVRLGYAGAAAIVLVTLVRLWSASG